MRLKKNRTITAFHRPAIPQKDQEGGSYVEYGTATPFSAEEWPGGGKLQASMYGMRLPNIRNLRVDGRYRETQENGQLSYSFANGMVVTAGDGICLNTSPESDPDYKIVAIYPYRFLALEVEKI